MLIFLIGSFVGLKLYQQQKTAVAGTTAAAQSAAGAQSASSGVAPDNGMGASPSPPAGSLTGAASVMAAPLGSDDDGSMAGTVQATQGASSDGPVSGFIGSFDQNVTQDDSGADHAGSAAWRLRGGINAVLDRIWAESMDVDYMCSQPGVAYRFEPPGNMRQDWNPGLNNQPWSRNTSFQATDPSGAFDTEDNGYGPAEDGEED